MSYEKELEYLRKEFNKSSAKFHQAEAEGYETDAEMWEDDMINIGHQIHIHEQAAKADEYEAKAKAFDRIVEERNQAGTSMYGKDDDVFYRVIENAFWNIDGIIVEYESGESDAKK